MNIIIISLVDLLLLNLPIIIAINVVYNIFDYK